MQIVSIGEEVNSLEEGEEGEYEAQGLEAQGVEGTEEGQVEKVDIIEHQEENIDIEEGDIEVNSEVINH